MFKKKLFKFYVKGQKIHQEIVVTHGTFFDES